jgi:hypothetical protein
MRYSHVISNINTPNMNTLSSKVFIIDFNTILQTMIAKENDDQSVTIADMCVRWIKNYAFKFRGLQQQRPKRLTWDEFLWTSIGALISMALVSFLHYKLFRP